MNPVNRKETGAKSDDVFITVKLMGLMGF